MKKYCKIERSLFKIRLTSILVVLLCSGFQMLSAQSEEYLIGELKNHKAAVKSLAFSPFGELFATGGDDKALFIINSGTLLVENAITDNYFPVVDIEFFGEDRLFITAGKDIKLIDKQNNKIALLEGNATQFWSIDFAPERNKITGGSYDKKIKVWDITTQKIVLTLEGHEKSTLAVVFSPDEKYLVSGSLDLTIKVWNAQSGELLKSFKMHSGNIYDIAFHPNSRFFASASDDKTIRLWDIEEGKVIKTYAGHDAGVLDIEFSPDGYFLYSASVDGTVNLWEVKTGRRIHSYNAHTGPVNTIAVSPDGNTVLTGGNDSKVFVWNSAKRIIIELNYPNEYRDLISSDPVFEEKRKGESKEAYADRKKEAEIRILEFIENYFEKYKIQNNNRNIPE